MRPLGLTAYRLAKDIGVPVTRVQAIIAERRGISGDTALRLARYFGTAPEFWLNMQRDYELETAAAALGSRLDTEVKPRAESEKTGISFMITQQEKIRLRELGYSDEEIRDMKPEEAHRALGLIN